MSTEHTCFHTATISFLRSALGLMSAATVSEYEYEGLVGGRMSYDGNATQFKSKLGRVVDWQRVVSEVWQSVQGTHGFSLLFSAVQSVRDNMPDESVGDEICALLQNYLEGYTRPRMSLSRTQEMSQRFLDYITSDEEKVQLLAPLASYKCAVNRFALPDNTIVRRIRAKEYTDFFSRTRHNSESQFRLNMSTHLLQHSANVPKSRPVTTCYLRELMLYHASVLSVFGPSRPVLAFVVVIPSWLGARPNSHMFSWATNCMGRHGDMLQRRHVPHLLQFAAQADRLAWRDKTCNPIRTAWAHFSSSVDCRYHEDILFRLVTALEALYFTDEAELALKLALRVAHHAGRSLSDRKRVYEAVKSAYKMRSNVVHGNKGYGRWMVWPGDDVYNEHPTGMPPFVTSDTTDGLFDIASRCIRAYVSDMNRGCTKQQIIEELDQALI